MDFRKLYAQTNYRILMLVPLLILVFSIGVLVYTHQTTGEWFQRSADLRGGTQITLVPEGGTDVTQLQAVLESRFGEVTIRELGGQQDRSLLISLGDVDPQEAVNFIKAEVDVRDVSYQQIGPALGETFWRQSQLGFITAFIFMAIVVFITFRTFVPSIAVIQAAVTAILGTLAVMQILNIELSLASFAALMLIIGYSVDTDILLTTRMLRRGGDVTERILSAMKTGLTMTLTAIVALLSLFIVTTYVTVIPALSNFSAVLVIALLIDIPATYLMNAGMLRWYLEKRGQR